MPVLNIGASSIRSEQWSLAVTAEWPEHEFQWRDYTKEDIRRALPLAPGGFDLAEVRIRN